jgi:hypothetical protein
VGKPEGKGQLGRTKCRVDYDFKLGLKIGCEVVDWIQLTYDIDSNRLL